MREELLGLTLDQARERLALRGIVPQVNVTSAPKRERETGGVLRVVHASDDGRRLTAARFLDPVSVTVQENG